MKMSSQHTAAPYYFVPGPSRWPLLAGMSLLMTMIGASAWVNDAAWGPYLNIAGIVCIIAVLYFWFGDAIGESERGLYNQRVDHAYRWSMSWFIFSEVMFFGAFFGALFYARTITMPWLGDLDHKILWPDFAAHWGNLGPAGTVEEFKTMSPFPIPTSHTALLLTSRVTLTIPHHALRADRYLLVHYDPAGRHLHGLPGVGIHGGLQPHEPEADLRDLWFDLLHADRLPRLPRDDGRDHAVGGVVPRAEGPLHARASLRLRGRGVVLALCRRGLAWPVRRRLLVVRTL